MPDASQGGGKGLPAQNAAVDYRSVWQVTVIMHLHPNGCRRANPGSRLQHFEDQPGNEMIAGVSEGLLLMRAGSRYRFTVPAYLAYGQNGMPPTIGPNQTLMFDIELLEVIP
jgi:hypothetical protein